MRITLCKDADALGKKAAELAAEIVNEAIAIRGAARVVLSTGNSQLETFEHLLRQKIDWHKVIFFHLDEYVNLPKAHPASFQKYLEERFFSRLPVAHYHLVTGDIKQIPELTAMLREAPIDLGMIGIGENAHIAFNDPPADFDTKEAFIRVHLEDKCKQQQVGEGWFAAIDDVPREAISMTVYQIMQCENIVSAVPRSVKAQAVSDMLTHDRTNMIPATVLKEHPRFNLMLDADSGALVNEKTIRPAPGRSVALFSD